MSNRRIIRLLLIGIAVLAVIHLLLFFQGVGMVNIRRVTLLDADALAATRLTVERRGERPTVFERVDGWRIVQPYSAPAGEAAIGRLVDRLAFARIRSISTEQELLKAGKTRAHYGLEDPLVTVSLAAGGKTHRIAFGMMTPQGDEVYASIEGDANVYVVGTNVYAAAALSSDGFRLREICPQGTAGVDAFELKRGTESFLSFTADAGRWLKVPAKATEAPEPASAARIRSLLEGLGRARIASYVWPVGATNEPATATASFLAGYGLDPASAVTVTLHGAGMVAQQVSFGSVAKEGKVYAIVQNEGAIVTVDGALSDFIRRTDFADPRLFPFEADSVTRVSVSEEGVDYVLAKGADGVWLLNAPVAAPADAENAELLLGRLLALTPKHRAAEGLVVSLQTNVPPETVSAEAVKHGFDFAGLRSREIVRIRPADVGRVTVRTGEVQHEAVTYDRDLRTWKVESSGRSGAVAAPAVERLLAELNPLRAERIVKLKVTSEDRHRYGLDVPRHTVAVDQEKEGSLRLNVRIGVRAPEGGSYATLGSSEYIFILSDETVARLTAPLVGD